MSIKAPCQSLLFLIVCSMASTANTATPAKAWWKTLAPEIEEVSIKSHLDGALQPTLFYAPPETRDVAAPLMVILHTWSSAYDQGWAKNYAQKCMTAQWAFICPHYRGPNNTPDATGSDKVVGDIADAVEYARQHARLDEKRIFIAGDSGGGYTALHMVGRMPEIWAAAIVGVPPTDLVDWFNYNRRYGGGYDRSLVSSCGGEPGKGKVDTEYRKRSPLTYLSNALNIPVDIKAGFYDKSVPFIHSIWAFNAIVPERERVPGDLIREWYAYMAENFYPRMKQEKNLEETLMPPASMAQGELARLEDSIFKIYYHKTFGNTILTITNGGHSGSTSASWQWLLKQKRLVDSASPEPYCTVKAGKVLRLSVSADDGHGGPLTYFWSVDGRKTGSQGREFEFHAARAGTAIVEVRIKDGDGFESLHVWVVEVAA